MELQGQFNSVLHGVPIGVGTTGCLRALCSRKKRWGCLCSGVPKEPEMVEVVNESVGLGVNTIRDAIDLMRTLNLILKPRVSVQVYPGW